MSEKEKKDPISSTDPNKQPGNKSSLYNALVGAGISTINYDSLLSSVLETSTALPSDSTLFDILGNDQRQLERDITTLKQQIADLGKAKGNLAQKKAELELKVGDLTEKLRLNFLLDRVNPEGQKTLLQSIDFQRLFLKQDESRSFVISIDIRRSTELMLKARNAQAFAVFITNLCRELMEIIKQSYGVIDKFTGDGVLAFYPEFYSGEHAAYRAMAAADACHIAFKRHYNNCRTSFKSILTDVGLGIGIDYGTVHLVQIAGGLTVVGEPVVYACRLSGAPAGVTLLNQPAYEKVMDEFSAHCFVSETALEIKHEGHMLAYEIRLNDKSYSPTIPNWVAQNGSLEEKRG